MPRFPTEDDLGRPASMATGSASVGDTGASYVVKGAKSLAADLGSINASWQAEREKDEEYQHTQRLVEFDLAQEKKLDDAKRTIAPDGANFTPSYRSSFDAEARSFVESTPPRLRQRAATQLSQIGARQEKRAYDIELATRDKYHEENVSKSLDGLIDDATAAPERYADHKIRGEAVIRSSKLSEPVKRRALSEFKSRMDEYTIGALEQRYSATQTKEDFEKLNQLRADVQKSSRLPESAPSQDLSALVKVNPSLLKDDKRNSLKGMRPEFNSALASMLSEMPPELRAELAIVQATRSNEYQAELYDKYRRGEGGIATPPGKSRHNHGEAIDFAPIGGYKAKTPGYHKALEWMYANSEKHGIVNPPGIRKNDEHHFELITQKDGRKVAFTEFAGHRKAAPDGTLGASTNDTAGSPSIKDGTSSTDDLTDVIYVDKGAVPFPDLTPERRRAVLTKLGNAVRGHAKRAAEGMIERIKLGGEIDESEFGRMLSPLTNDQKLAISEKYHTARTVANTVRGFEELPEQEISKRYMDLGRVKVDDTLAKAHSAAVKEVEKKIADLRKLRDEDPVQPTLRTQTVKEAARIAKAQGAQPLTPAYYEFMIPARVEAQRKAGTLPGREVVILKEEARVLLQLPRGSATESSEKDWQKSLAAASDRFKATFGERYYRQAFEQAITMFRKTETGKGNEIASGIARKLIQGEPVRPQEYERMRMLERVNGLDTFWRTPDRGMEITLTRPGFVQPMPLPERRPDPGEPGATPSLSLGTDGTVLSQEQ